MRMPLPRPSVKPATVALRGRRSNPPIWTPKRHATCAARSSPQTSRVHASAALAAPDCELMIRGEENRTRGRGGRKHGFTGKESQERSQERFLTPLVLPPEPFHRPASG